MFGLPVQDAIGIRRRHPGRVQRIPPRRQLLRSGVRNRPSEGFGIRRFRGFARGRFSLGGPERRERAARGGRRS